MATSKKAKKAKSKKPRSAAQKAATARMRAGAKRSAAKKSPKRGSAKRGAKRKNPSRGRAPQSMIMDAYENPTPKKGSAKKTRSSNGAGLAGRVSKLETKVKNHDARLSNVESKVSKAISGARSALKLKSGGKKRAKKLSQDPYGDAMKAWQKKHPRGNPGKGKVITQRELERILAR